jgi:hypothetical protein
VKPFRGIEIQNNYFDLMLAVSRKYRDVQTTIDKFFAHANLKLTLCDLATNKLKGATVAEKHQILCVGQHHTQQGGFILYYDNLNLSQYARGKCHCCGTFLSRLQVEY